MLMNRLLFGTYRSSIAITTIGAKSASTKVCVIGAGRMADAFLNALKSKGTDPTLVTIYDNNEGRLNYVHKKYGVNVSTSAHEGAKDAEIVLLAVKPQNVKSVAQLLPEPITGLLLSIVAGCTIQQLQGHFKTDKIIRSMPNTPAMVQQGITVWTATPQVPRSLVEKGKELLACLGEEMEVTDEKYLDMATAISGSGPAYVFLTMEAMIDAGVHLGFPRETAKRLVSATIRGSAAYAEVAPDSVGALRENVTSPGGTTASALYELERGGFRTVVADAIWAAYRRALELGGDDPNVGPNRNKFMGRR